MAVCALLLLVVALNVLAACIKEAFPPASCVVSDAAHPWASRAVRELGVPWLAFDGFCAFSSFCMHLMNLQRIYEGINDDKRPVRIPSFPIDVEISRAQSLGNFTVPSMKEYYEEIIEESARADGMVINSFAELEPTFLEAYEKSIGKKIWTVGPLFLTAAPSTATSEDDNVVRCSIWLESKKPRSVVFLSFHKAPIARELVSPAQPPPRNVGREDVKGDDEAEEGAHRHGATAATW